MSTKRILHTDTMPACGGLLQTMCMADDVRPWGPMKCCGCDIDYGGAVSNVLSSNLESQGKDKDSMRRLQQVTSLRRSEHPIHHHKEYSSPL